jgi:hypothetical protein
MTPFNSVRTSLAAALALGALAITTPALADDHATTLSDLTDKLAYKLDQETLGDPKWTETVSSMESLDPPSKCYDAVAAAKAAGLTDDTRIYGDQTFRWKTAKKDDKGMSISLAEVAALCKRYDDTYIHEYVEAALVDTFQQKYQMEHAVEGQYESEARRVGDSGATCAKWVDAALAHGLPASELIESTRYKMPAIELGKAKADLCQPAIDFGAKRQGAIKDLAKSKQDAIVAVYKKAGIKGKRLELFVSYGMPEDTGFLAAGCETWITSIGALKKAKKLFVWLEGDSGYTIRKFTIKGDSYKVSEKQFSSKEGAYAGCR